MPSQFDKLRSKQNTTRDIDTVLKKAKDLYGEGVGAVSADTAKRFIGNESLNDIELNVANEAHDSVIGTFQPMTYGKDKRFTQAQLNAAADAAIVASNPREALRRDVSLESYSGAVVGSLLPSDALAKRPGLEAFDEVNNRNLLQRTITYNLFAARQDDFGEALYPTITIPSDVNGLSVSTDIMFVYDGVTRDPSGDPDFYNKKMILRAFADPSILRMDQTRIIPVHRTESEKYFVPAADVAPVTIDHDGIAIKTAPLATGKRISLLAISQYEAMLAAGANDQTDSIDPAITLTSLYVKVGNDVLKLNTEAVPYSVFNPPIQMNYRQMTLNLDTLGIMINKDTKTAAGGELVTLADVKNNNLLVKLRVEATGSVNIETAETIVHGNMVSVVGVVDASGVKLDLSAGQAAAIVALFESASIIGYELKAFRTNINRRIMGQLIDTTTVTQNYMVWLRSPVVANRPLTDNGDNDAKHLNTLVTITHARTSADAVNALQEGARILRTYWDSRSEDAVPPEILGIGRFLVVPTYLTADGPVDLGELVQSLSSIDREQAIQMAIINLLRTYVYEMYVRSQFQSASKALNGGVEKTPTVIIATDPQIARYIMTTGDLRTMANEFDLRIVHTLNKNMKGKLYMTFGDFSESRNTDINPLSWGFMAWAPEVTIVTDMIRNGAKSVELAVSPRYLHVNNLPILCELDITGIEKIGQALPIQVANTVVTP